jgi:hypothetical protein
VTAPEEPPANPLEGAGVFSAYADLGIAFQTGGPGQVSFASASAALETLGFVADPFGSLLSAGVGWIIENVGFLKDGLDMLAGNPADVLASARSWAAVGVELAEVAAQRRGAPAPQPGGVHLGGLQPPGWEGMASLACQQAAEAEAARMEDVARQAVELGGLLVNVGAMVATVRSLIRDLIADFAAQAIPVLLGAAVGAVVSAGGALAAGVTWVIGRAVQLGVRIADWIQRLLTQLAAAGETAARIADGMRTAARWTGESAMALHLGAGPVADFATGVVPIEEVVEAGKQLTTAHQA